MDQYITRNGKICSVTPGAGLQEDHDSDVGMGPRLVECDAIFPIAKDRGSCEANAKAIAKYERGARGTTVLLDGVPVTIPATID
jgi:hypothetical protein